MRERERGIVIRGKFLASNRVARCRGTSKEPLRLSAAKLPFGGFL